VVARRADFFEPPRQTPPRAFLRSLFAKKHLAMATKKRTFRFHGNSAHPRNPITLKKAYLFDLQILEKQHA